MHRSISDKVTLGFGLALAFLAAIGAVSYRSTSELIETVHWEVHAHKVLNELHDVLFQLQNAETGQRGFIITGEPRYLGPYRRAMAETDREVATLRQLTADNVDQQRHLDVLEELIQRKFAELQDTISLREKGEADAALRLIRTDVGRVLMDEIHQVVDAMETEESALLRQREAAADENARITLFVLVLLSSLAIGFGTLAMWIINRDVVARRRAEEEVARANAELETRIRERTAELAEVNRQLQQKIAETQSAERVLQQSSDEMAAILNQLRIGTVKTDAEGCVTFLSRVAEKLFGLESGRARGTHWRELFAPRVGQTRELLATAGSVPADRSKVPLRMQAADGRNYWMEIEIQDDPRDASSKVFFLYDVSEVRDLRRVVDDRTEFHGLVGKSKPMQVVYQQIQALSNVDSTVLIQGETGTGKELVARAIHASSHRRDKPFIAVNSAGLMESLLDSQLFGHKRGAFTGAIHDHRGVFETAEGGTLLLDEIGDIPANVQTSLLRVLQEKEITRLGESRPRKIDVRVLAASQRRLDDEVARGAFRADLLYRLRIARIQLPSLRERREDIPLLVAWFLHQYQLETGKPPLEVSSDAMRALLDHWWPGNVRELKNAVEFAVIQASHVIRPENLPPEVTEQGAGSGKSELLVAAELDERAQLLAALEQAGQNRTVAARLLGVSRATLYRRLASLKIH